MEEYIIMLSTMCLYKRVAKYKSSAVLFVGISLIYGENFKLKQKWQN